jgi:hypothetical protein
MPTAKTTLNPAYGQLRKCLPNSTRLDDTIYPGSVATNVSRNALTAEGTARGRSDKAIDNGIPADTAATAMLDGIAKGEREIIVAEGGELAMGEARRTPDALFDQVAGMVANGYMDKLEAAE